MDSAELTQRLSRIGTRWSIVLDAHAGTDDGAGSARRMLLEHYSRAVYRYLLGGVRDPDAAEELAQEFALRLLRGDFRRANPDRGRFRDYVKTVLVNLVNDHHRKRRQWPAALDTNALSAAVPPESVMDGPSFEDCLREEILDHTWQALERQNPRYHAVLRLRAQQPEAASSELAGALSADGAESWTADQVRKTLERSRAKFADLLLDEVAACLDCTTPDDVQAALASLDLAKYCRGALKRREERA